MKDSAFTFHRVVASCESLVPAKAALKGVRVTPEHGGCFALILATGEARVLELKAATPESARRPQALNKATNNSSIRSYFLHRFPLFLIILEKLLTHTYIRIII